MGFQQHAIAARVWRAIGDAVHLRMDIYARSQGFSESFLFSALDDLLYGKVGLTRMLFMQQSRCNPDFVGYFDFVGN